MRTLSDKMAGRPGEPGTVLDNERLAEKLDLQERQYRARNADPALAEKAQKLIKKAYPKDIDLAPLVLVHEIALPYLHNAATQCKYKAIPDAPGTHSTGPNKPCWYGIPKVDLELARMELRRFGIIKEV